MKRQAVPENYWDLTKLEKGTIVYDVVKEGYRLLIMRGPAGWCCYIGVPLDSPLARMGYSDDALAGFECHGGLTYANDGDDVWRPTGWWYFGWDYGHAGDWSPIYDEAGIGGLSSHTGEKKWKFSEVKAQMESAFTQMKEICTNVPNRLVVGFQNRQPIVRNGHKRMIRINEE
jgi:hypothetical protein